VDGLITVEPDRVRRVPVAGYSRYHANKYRHPFRKVGLFTVRDGPLQTIRKIRSKLVERRIEAAQEILVCRWTASDGGRRIGITRELGGAPRFHPELVFTAPAGLDVDEVVLEERVIGRLEAYLPVPECPLAGVVAEAIRATNDALGPATASSEAAPETARGRSPARAAGPASISSGSAGEERGRVFLLGYGGYVREQVLPAFGDAVAGATDRKAELLRREHRRGFPLYPDLGALLPAIAEAERPLVIVATYHSDHARSALAVLDANPAARVFIEKPATVSVADAESLAERRAAGSWIDVGFNRRYAAMTADLKEAAGALPRPLVFSALVKELKLPSTHWYHWPNQGTRVTGNLCHWIDLAHHLVGEPCESVQAIGSGGAGDAVETVSATLRFADGSVATLVATDAGDDLGGVGEHLELRAGGATMIVDDYRRLIRLEEGRRSVRRARREKGHDRMYRDLRRRWREGGEPAYPAVDILAVARTTARIVEAVAGGRGG
jgi:predicted dehydrogenase